MNSIENPPKKRNLVLILVFINAGALLIAAGLIIGIDDNPIGISLCLLGVLSLFLALVHPWRKVLSFGVLAIISLAAFLFFAVVHNFLEGGAELVKENQFWSQVLEVSGAAFFLIATLMAPIGILVGLGGMIYASVRKRRN